MLRCKPSASLKILDEWPAGSTADTARTPYPAARPALGRETGNGGGAPGTRCLPPAATASDLQLRQSATSSGTDVSASGPVPSQEPASSNRPGTCPPDVEHEWALAHPHADRHWRLHPHNIRQPFRLEAPPRQSQRSSDIQLQLQDDPAPIPMKQVYVGLRDHRGEEAHPRGQFPHGARPGDWPAARLHHLQWGSPPSITLQPSHPQHQRRLTDFQRAIEVNTPPGTLPNRSVTPAVPDDLSTCEFVFVGVEVPDELH